VCQYQYDFGILAQLFWKIVRHELLKKPCAAHRIQSLGRMPARKAGEIFLSKAPWLLIIPSHTYVFATSRHEALAEWRVEEMMRCSKRGEVLCVKNLTGYKATGGLQRLKEIGAAERSQGAAERN
jgi:hypothetical protein